MGMAERRHWSAEVGRRVVRLARWSAGEVRGGVERRVGGPARTHVVILFAVVLALNGADASTVGAIAPQLESSLHINNTDLGLLSSVSLLVGALFTVPIGMLVDRTKRMPLLAFSIVLWSVASLLSAFAGSFSSLLLSRLALGAVAGTAGPAISSLSGDFFAPHERGRIWSYILVGEAAGTAFGFIVSGLLASLIDWRAAFAVLAIPGFLLARELWRTVPEPLRGGQSHLEIGAVDLDLAFARANARAQPGDPQAGDDAPTDDVRREMKLGSALRYIFSIPSNVAMIIGSSLGYFYFAGLQTFALLFVKGHYHASQATAELVLALLVTGAAIGTVLGGQLSDSMLERGNLAARVWLPGVCYIGAGLALIPGFVVGSLNTALWFDVAGAALISAANPPIQAARLDVMPAGLWGRASSALTAVRSLAQALAPLLFGAVSELVAGIVPQQALIGTHPHAPSSATTTGLQVSFLIMIAALFAAGVILIRARSSFTSDVATAVAAEPPA